MSNQELAARIIELIGGNSNISRAAHCMTRLRLNLYNNDLIQLKEIESLKGVLGAQMQNQQLQIIIGPQVGSLYNEIAAQANLNPAADATKTNQKLFTRFLDILSGIFLPVIPAMAGIDHYRRYSVRVRIIPLQGIHDIYRFHICRRFPAKYRHRHKQQAYHHRP